MYAFVRFAFGDYETVDLGVGLAVDDMIAVVGVVVRQADIAGKDGRVGEGVAPVAPGFGASESAVEGDIFREQKRCGAGVVGVGCLRRFISAAGEPYFIAGFGRVESGLEVGKGASPGCSVGGGAGALIYVPYGRICGGSRNC